MLSSRKIGAPQAGHFISCTWSAIWFSSLLIVPSSLIVSSFSIVFFSFVLSPCIAIPFPRNHQNSQSMYGCIYASNPPLQWLYRFKRQSSFAIFAEIFPLNFSVPNQNAPFYGNLSSQPQIRQFLIASTVLYPRHIYLSLQNQGSPALQFALCRPTSASICIKGPPPLTFRRVVGVSKKWKITLMSWFSTRKDNIEAP